MKIFPTNYRLNIVYITFCNEFAVMVSFRKGKWSVSTHIVHLRGVLWMNGPLLSQQEGTVLMMMMGSLRKLSSFEDYVRT